MATGACGINCSVCRLHQLGKCGSCGPATGELASLKIEVQKQLFGDPCALLACARLNHVTYCLSDCNRFPCENYSSGPYPFSEPFLAMQKRRREEATKEDESKTSSLLLQEHWDALRKRDPKLLADLCVSGSGETEWLTIRLLDRMVRINPQRERVEEQAGGQDDGLWRLASLITSQMAVFYLLQGKRICLSGNWLPEHQLKCGSFFRGVHQLPVERLLERFDKKSNSFLIRSKQLGGFALEDMGDAAVQIWVLPQVPVKLILWCSDDELPPSLTVLFDSSIEQVLAADAIWAMFRFLMERLLEEE